jgi:hypothetical protein
MFLHLCHLHPRKSSCIASLWFINSLHALIRAPAPPFHHDSTNEGCRTHHTAVALLLGRIAPGAPTGGVAFLLAALPALSGLAGSWFSFAGSSPFAPPLGAASAPRRPWAQRLRRAALGRSACGRAVVLGRAALGRSACGRAVILGRAALGRSACGRAVILGCGLSLGLAFGN